MKSNQKGFTLVELVLVITVLGILAVAALPQFISVRGSALTASRAGTVGAIRTGISNLFAAEQVKTTPAAGPAALDAAAAGACTTANGCFGNVLGTPVSDVNWVKTATGYTYTDGTLSCDYVYTASTASVIGSFANNPATAGCP